MYLELSHITAGWKRKYIYIYSIYKITIFLKEKETPFLVGGKIYRAALNPRALHRGCKRRDVK